MSDTVTSIELLRSSRSWDGAPLPDYPAGKPELVVRRLTFAPGQCTSWHTHPVINYGIVEQGSLTVVRRDGIEHTFHPGEALVEMVDTPHRGENRGTVPVVLTMFYLTAPGQPVTVDL